MLKVEQLRWFSGDFKVLDDQSIVAIGHYGWWREAGSLTIGESSYKVHREGFVSPAFILEENGTVVARANERLDRFLVDHAGRLYVLVRSMVRTQGFVLREDEQVIGWVNPESSFRHTFTVDLPEKIPLPVRVFMVWLVIKQPPESAASAPSAD